MKAFVPPTEEEVRVYCNERANRVDPVAWMAHYEAKGWMIGKNKMRDWRAAVRTWERSRKEGQNGGSARLPQTYAGTTPGW